MIVFIEPVKGIREIADRVEIKVINYVLQGAEQTLYYCLQSQFNKMIEEGNLIIPEPVVAQWGVDDSIIVDFAFSTLGLKERIVKEVIEEVIEEDIKEEVKELIEEVKPIGDL